MATDSGYEKGNYLRVCDICGHRYHFRDLTPIGELRFACPDDAPGLTSLQISRFNARAKPLVVRPNKWAKDYSQTPIYQLAEGQVFNFVAQVAPSGERDGSSEPLAAAWATIYLAETDAHEKRPRYWDVAGTRTITTCCDYLLTLQYGSPTGSNPSGTIDNPRYGGILVDDVRQTETTIAAGIAFLKAYALTQRDAYLMGARRAGTFIRHVQSGNVQASAYTTYPHGGGAYYVKGLASSVNETTGLLATTYYLADVLGLWFLTLLSAQVGASTTFGDAAATAFFGANAASLTTMIADLVYFGETGARDEAQASALTSGLSTTAPRQVYQAATNGSSTPAGWTAQSTMQTSAIAGAVRGLHEAGRTAVPAAVLAWLQTFTSNADNRTPAGADLADVLAGATGTYNPAICPADELVTAAPFTEADNALYDWASFGLLAPLLTPARSGKDAVSTARRYSAVDITNVWLGPIGSSGLSYQPVFRGADGRVVGLPGSTIAGGAAGTTPALPTVGLVLRLEGDKGLSSSGGVVSAWADQSGFGQNFTATPGFEPHTGLATIDGVPCVSFRDFIGGASAELVRTGGIVDRNGTIMGYNTGESPGITVMSVFRPLQTLFSVYGGPIFHRVGSASPPFQAIFDNEDNLGVDGFWVWSRGWRNAADSIQGPNTVKTTYNDTVVVAEWRSAAFPEIEVAVNGVELALTPTTMPGVVGGAATPFAMIGDVLTGAGGLAFGGDIAAIYVWDHKLDADETTRAREYVGSAFGSSGLGFTWPSAVVRAAKTGLAYRYNPGRYPLLRGN